MLRDALGWLRLFSIPICVFVTKNCLPVFCSRSRISRRHGKKNLILRKVMTISLGKYTGLSMTKALAPTWWLTGYNRLSVLNVAVLFQEVQLRVGFLIRWL